MLALVPELIARLDENPEKVWIATAADFSSNYADSYHHAKEEDILFKYSEACFISMIQIILLK